MSVNRSRSSHFLGMYVLVLVLVLLFLLQKQLVFVYIGVVLLCEEYRMVHNSEVLSMDMNLTSCPYKTESPRFKRRELQLVCSLASSLFSIIYIYIYKPPLSPPTQILLSWFCVVCHTRHELIKIDHLHGRVVLLPSINNYHRLWSKYIEYMWLSY